MPTLTQQQYNNCQKALEIIEDAPDSCLNLLDYKIESEGCRTLFCSLGWLTESKAFEAQGLKWDDYVHIIPGKPIRHFPSTPETTSDRLFGPDAWDTLFIPRQFNEPDADDTATDKEIAIRRLRRRLAEATIKN